MPHCLPSESSYTETLQDSLVNNILALGLEHHAPGRLEGSLVVRQPFAYASLSRVAFRLLCICRYMQQTRFASPSISTNQNHLVNTQRGPRPMLIFGDFTWHPFIKVSNWCWPWSNIISPAVKMTQMRLQRWLSRAIKKQDQAAAVVRSPHERRLACMVQPTYARFRNYLQ
jgi:hypothetical protein